MRCVVFVCQSADLYMMNFSKGELVQRGQYAVKGKCYLMLKSTGAKLYFVQKYIHFLKSTTFTYIFSLNWAGWYSYVQNSSYLWKAFWLHRSRWPNSKHLQLIYYWAIYSGVPLSVPWSHILFDGKSDDKSQYFKAACICLVAW